MKYLDIQGDRFPAIGLGTSGLEGKRCTDVVRTALGLGYRHIDTAQAYGNEREVGRAIAASGVKRADIFVVTKVWRSSLKPRDVHRSTEGSLDALGTEFVDLLLVHWPNDSIPLGDTLTAFGELKAAGKARHIGVSNFPLKLLREAVETHRAPVFANQVEYHPLLDHSALLAYMRARNIALTAYSPLGRGRLVNNPVLAEIGRKRGRSASQIALAWLLRQDGVAAIPKFSSEAHGRANLEAFGIALDEGELEAIAGLDKGFRVWEPSWGPNWRES
jgi:2,5-diketo-D-gluconate reductase B